MNVTKEPIDKVRVKLSIEVDEALFNDHLDQVFKKHQKSIAIPGFRKGHAPRALIEKHYGKESFFFEAAEEVVFPAYMKALEENPDLEVVGQGDFDVVQMEVGKPFIFSVEVDTKQDIDLPDYKGIALEKQASEPTEEAIDAELARIQSNVALYANKGGENAEVEEGDLVVFDYVGTKDGVAFEGGTASNHELEIGSQTFIPGFEDGMKGLKVGEEKDIPLTFPEEYHAEDLAGQEVNFHVTLHEIKHKVLPELDDEFAKDVSEFETLAEFKEDIKNNIAKRMEEAAKNAYFTSLTEQVVEGSDVVAPASLVDQQADHFYQDIENNFKSQGFDMAQYFALTGETEDKVREECKVRAEASVKRQLVLEAIAEKEEIQVSDEALDEEYDKLAGIYQLEKDQLKQIFALQGQEEALRGNLLMEKTLDFLLEQAKIG